MQGWNGCLVLDDMHDYAYKQSMHFTWDESKRQSNLIDHGLDFADAEKVFAGPLVLFEDR